MKRIILVLLCLVFAFMMTGCVSDLVAGGMGLLKAAISSEEIEEETPEIIEPEIIGEDYIRPEFKKMMDQYEEFFDEYILFMQNLENADSDNSMQMLGLWTDYFDWLEKYEKAMEALDSIEDSELTRAESIYYTEVLLRIEQKLLEGFE